MHPHLARQSRPLIIGVVFAAIGGVLLTAALAGAAQASSAAAKQAVVTVEGMQCPFCAYGIKKHLRKLPGATRVDVELARNQAIVTFTPDADVTNDQIQQAVRKAGFTPGKIEWRSGGRDDAK